LQGPSPCLPPPRSVSGEQTLWSQVLITELPTRRLIILNFNYTWLWLDSCKCILQGNTYIYTYRLTRCVNYDFVSDNVDLSLYLNIVSCQVALACIYMNLIGDGIPSYTKTWIGVQDITKSMLC